MNGITNPANVIASLAKIEHAGLSSDMLAAITGACRHRVDLERWPDYTLNVKRFARLARSLLGGSLQQWEAAACEALLPDTHTGIVLDIIDEFEQLADEAAVAAQASAKLSRERRRR